MTKNDTDDERFRRELIVHGIPTRDAAPLPGDGARAAVQLARILALPQRKSTLLRRLAGGASGWRSRRLGLIIVATAAAIVATFFAVLSPGGEGYVAQAGTPPLLRLRGVEPGALPASGEPAGDTLRDLATKALSLPYDSTQPVQHVVVESWLSESGVEIGEGAVQSVLRSVRRESYFLPGDTVRNIERREGPLDQHGRITTPLARRARGSATSPSPCRTRALDMPRVCPPTRPLFGLR